jgi:hypothetical protein
MNDTSKRDPDRDRERKSAEENSKHIGKTERVESVQDDSPNPPRTTRGKFTAPKFGSAGSGGAELEPGPEKD